MDDIRKICLETFAAVLKIDTDTINDDSSPETHFEWDSLAHVQLILALEKACSVEIPPDTAIELESFKMVVEWIKEQKKEP